MAMLTILGLLLSLSLFHYDLFVSAQSPDSSDSWDSAISGYSQSNSRKLSQFGSLDMFDYDSIKRYESDSAVTLRLYGNTIMGYYYVTLFFGSPLQRQNLIVDTGSTITTIPCTECGSECGKRHLNKPFDKAQSESHQGFKCSERFSNYMCHDCENQCPFNIGYTEGSSYQGHFTKDYVVFGDEIEDYYVKKGFMNAPQPEGPNSHFRPGPGESREVLVRRNTGEDTEATAIQDIIDRRKVYMPFGCTVKETKLFYYQEADGILGLGVYTNSMKLPPNVVDVFGMSKDGAFNAFSICLASEGGLFTIGGYNKSHHDKSDTIKYVPFYAESGQYRVHMNRIEFEGQDLNLSEKSLNHGQGAFFDSGTTLAYAPLGTVQAIKDALGQHCSLNSNNCGGNRRRGTCWLYNPDNNPTVDDFYASFGTFSIYFGEDGLQRYEWKPQDYLYQENSGSRWFCLGVEVFEDRTILGGTFMKNHDIIFDKREKRIGFVRANCTITIPEWIGTAKLDESKATSDNLLALCIIFCVAIIIYTLIRTNRKWAGTNKSLFPLSWTETLGFGRVNSPKGKGKLVSPE